MDARVNTADDLSTSDRNLVNVCPVTSEICMRVWVWRAIRWALPRISSFIVVAQQFGRRTWNREVVDSTPSRGIAA